MSVDYSSWSVDELVEEIRREEQALADYKNALTDARTRYKLTDWSIGEERLVYFSQRIQSRANRIDELQTWINTRQTRIFRAENSLSRRDTTIKRLEASLATQAQRLLSPYISGMESFLTRRTIQRLRRSLGGYRGWQTRTVNRLQVLRRGVRAARRTLSSLQGWQKREAPYLSRLNELRQTLTYWRREISELEWSISLEEDRLQIKRDELDKKRKQVVHVKVVLFSVAKGPPNKPYSRRFQIFYNIDALRNPKTGILDYTSELTETEIGIIKQDFYGRWGWNVLPAECTEPEMAETGVIDVLEEPKGADIKEMSVREEGEETYNYKFFPHEILYSPSTMEKDEMASQTTIEGES